MALLISCKPDKIQYILSQKSQCYKRNGESAAVQLSSYIIIIIIIIITVFGAPRYASALLQY